MKFLALSVILALAVTLSSAVSIDQALHQEWHVFKVFDSKLEWMFVMKHIFDLRRARMERATR